MTTFGFYILWKTNVGSRVQKHHFSMDRYSSGVYSWIFGATAIYQKIGMPCKL